MKLRIQRLANGVVNAVILELDDGREVPLPVLKMQRHDEVRQPPLIAMPGKLEVIEELAP